MRVLVVLFIATLAVLALLFTIGPDREFHLGVHDGVDPPHLLAAGGMVRGAGAIPDLRVMNAATIERFHDIVLRGALEARGMGRYDDALSQDDSACVLGYILYRANADRAKAIAEGKPAA